ncbi:MAG: hypothetical protein U1F66_01030 [bacterium]
MKKFGFLLLIGLVAGSLPLGKAWAGIDYNSYHEQFRSEQGMKGGTATEGKRFEHQSKYQRGQEMPDNMLPTRERDLNRPTPRSDVTK